jgi:hypothetical protein
MKATSFSVSSKTLAATLWVLGSNVGSALL